MPFLIAKDFSKQIQSDNLSQIIGGDQSITAAAAALALEEITSYLIQKYDLTNALQPSNPWANSQAYTASNQVYLDAPLYQAASAYVVGQYAVQAANFYKCTTNTTGVFDPTKWALIAPQYSFYFAQYPYPVFTYETQYAVGDQVFWKDKTYTCLIATQPLSQSSALQFGSYQNLPLLNVAPDNVNTGARTWGTGIAYSVPISTAITDTTKWTAGDNRSQQLVTYAVDITLYHLHSRIAPRNIPELRKDRRNEAREWLKAISRGEITANIPLLQPTQGARIRYGGQIKNINSF